MKNKFTMGSLFSGSGGFELSAKNAGIEAKWLSEIEPYPLMVTHKRLPNVKQYGDVSSIKGEDMEPVDIITFGSPCQSVSVAGKRHGIKHADINGDEETTRSGLFFDVIRIIEEMREKTGKPRYGVLENVAGLFSSSDGEDFRRVLEETCQVKDINAEIPKLNAWPKAGEIRGGQLLCCMANLGHTILGTPPKTKASVLGRRL